MLQISVVIKIYYVHYVLEALVKKVVMFLNNSKALTFILISRK